MGTDATPPLSTGGREQQCLWCGYPESEHTAQHLKRRCHGFGASATTVRKLRPEPDGKGATGSGQSLRTGVLQEAESLVMGDRNNTYGEPHQDFARTAGVLSSLGYRGPEGRNIEAHDVAVIVTAVKLSRLMWTPLKRDTWVDIAGYAACGFEAAERTRDEGTGKAS